MGTESWVIYAKVTPIFDLMRHPLMENDEGLVKTTGRLVRDALIQGEALQTLAESVRPVPDTGMNIDPDSTGQ